MLRELVAVERVLQSDFSIVFYKKSLTKHQFCKAFLVDATLETAVYPQYQQRIEDMSYLPASIDIFPQLMR